MEPGSIIERSAAAVGQTWTAELHEALVHHVAEIERTYQALIRRREDNLERNYKHHDIPPFTSEAVYTYYNNNNTGEPRWCEYCGIKIEPGEFHPCEVGTRAARERPEFRAQARQDRAEGAG